MDLEQHIKNLKDYIRIDKENINYDDSDFAQFCKSHCEDIQAVLKELDNRIPREKVNEIIDDYENQLTEKNNYIFNLESEREALWNKLDEEFE